MSSLAKCHRAMSLLAIGLKHVVRPHFILIATLAEKWLLEIFNAQFHGRVRPCSVELLFDERRFVIALLHEQALR